MKKYWIYFSSLIVVVFLVEYDLARRASQKINLAQKDKLNLNQEKRYLAVESAQSALTPKQILTQAQEISKEELDPSLAEIQIEKIAHTLTITDILKFSSLIEDTQEKNDHRSMAIELLARKKSNESLQILNKFVENHAAHPKKSQDVNIEFESVLRAQAIEGIASYPVKDLALSYLNSLSQKVNEAFLKERISRSEENLKSVHSQTKSDQDSDLKKLIE